MNDLTQLRSRNYNHRRIRCKGHTDLIRKSLSKLPQQITFREVAMFLPPNTANVVGLLRNMVRQKELKCVVSGQPGRNRNPTVFQKI